MDSGRRTREELAVEGGGRYTAIHSATSKRREYHIFNKCY